MSNSEIKDDSTLIIEKSFGDIKFYVFRNNNTFFSVISKRNGPFWNSYITNKYYSDFNNPIDTVGYANVSEDDNEMIILAIKSNTNDIKYIKSGHKDEEFIRPITKDSVEILYWEGVNRITQINAFALSKDKETLYYYGFPENTKYDELNKINWYSYN